MISVLEPLTQIPGVRIALLVGNDGVPVVARSQQDGEPTVPGGVDENTDALAALASGWLGDMTRAVAPLTWGPPKRVVLWAARGTLVMCHAPGAVLLVILDRGARPEDLRLPMGAAVARIQRVLRNMRSEREQREEREALADFEDDTDPPSALPYGSSTGLDLVRPDSSKRRAR